LRKEKNCQSCFKQMRKSSWLELRPKLKFQSIYAIFLLRVFARDDGPIEKRKPLGVIRSFLNIRAHPVFT
jgi:hypothetical protein